jgi:hypothetical protein
MNALLTYLTARLLRSTRNECEGCSHEPIPGIRFATRDDGSRAIERCDTCERFESDNAALTALETYVKSSA